jgi:hypothetical protein
MNNRSAYEPDVIITQKFLAAKYRGAAVSSEKRLMLAVLTHALHDYQDYFLSTDRAQQILADEAADWIQCTRNDHMFSFENVSETLGFDAGYLRRGIVAWRIQRLLTLQQEIPQSVSVIAGPG